MVAITVPGRAKGMAARLGNELNSMPQLTTKGDSSPSLAVQNDTCFLVTRRRRGRVSSLAKSKAGFSCKNGNHFHIKMLTNKFLKGPALWVLFFLVLGASGAPIFAQEVLESQGLTLRLIPGGTYLLGSPADEPGRYADEALPHPVTLKPFYIAVTETTNAQYAQFLKATKHQPPLYWQDKNLNAPNQPVVGVTWDDAVAFTEWLTRVTGARHRLPTEDEWEAAARGGLIGQPYPWGPETPDAQGVYRANYYPNDFGDDGFRLTAPVGSFPPNGYGLYDMAGNVAEWCLDRYFPPGLVGPFNAPGNRTLKGGSWYSRARDLRCAAGQAVPPQSADGFMGFRVMRPLAPAD
jgi:formylglycine-generating enzyme required for sulfatase activity